MKALVQSRESKPNDKGIAGAKVALELRQVPDPEAGEEEAVIRVKLAGICRTDLELARGYMDFSGIPGHEFVGMVEHVNSADGDLRNRYVGRRVVGEINCGCGFCDWCLSGLQRHCPDRTVLGILGRDGAFAEYLTLPTGNLHVVPDGMDDETAVFTEPLAAALEILEQVRVKPTDRILVVGDGKLGLLISRVLQIRGCDPLCIGRHESKLNLLRRWGIKAMHRDDYRPVKCDLVIEASGSPEGFQTALASLRPRGTLILKSTYADRLTLDAAALVIHEITVLGSRCGPFAPALRLLDEGLIPVKDLITSIYPFDETPLALKHAADPDALKILLRLEVS